MNNRNTRQPEFTGRHMLLILIAFFGVIITVNLTMATLANTSWSGLVVQNSYVASQHFNDRLAAGRALAELGWESEIVLEEGQLRYTLRNGDGNAVAISSVEADIRRPVQESEDHTLALAPVGDGAYAAPLLLEDGQWIVDVTAEAGLSEPWRDIRRILVRNGTIR